MIQISQNAATAIFEEVRRYVDHGIQEHGAPFESLLYPLSALIAGTSFRCPLEMVSLADVRGLVIDGAAIPPDAIKSFSSHNCHFDLADVEQANASFNATIDELLLARPRLAVLSKAHTHPFAGGAFLSSGDHYFGIDAPEARAWRARRGLAFALLHVVYPDGDPGLSRSSWRLSRSGALGPSKSGRGRVHWRLRSFGHCDTDGQTHDLGDAEIVGSNAPNVRAARRAPYWLTREGSGWCDAQKALLKDRGYAVSRNVLGRGWRRYLLRLGQRHFVIVLPPDFPAAPLRVLEVEDALRDRFSPIDLPAKLTTAPTLTSAALVPVASWLAAKRPGAS